MMNPTNHNSADDTPDILKRIKDTNSGYKLPNDYFSMMQASVLRQAVQPEVAQSITWMDRLESLFQYKYRLSVITAIALLGFMILSNPDTTTKENETIFSDLGETDFEYYLDNDLDTWNNQDLMAVLSEDEINIADISVPLSTDNALTGFPEEYIEDLEDDSLLDYNFED